MTACDKFQQVQELLTQILPSDSADWANAVVGGADRKLTFVTLTYHGSGPIYGTPRHPPWYFDPGSPTRVPKKQPFRGSPRLKTVSSGIQRVSIISKRISKGKDKHLFFQSHIIHEMAEQKLN